MLHCTKLFPRKVDKLIRVAIPTGQSVTQELRGQVCRQDRRMVSKTVIVRLRTQADNRVMPKHVAARLQQDTMNPVPMAVDKRIIYQVVPQRQSLEDDFIAIALGGLQIKQQGSRTRNLVSEAATDSNSDIEGKRVLMGLSHNLVATFAETSAPLANPYLDPNPKPEQLATDFDLSSDFNNLSRCKQRVISTIR